MPDINQLEPGWYCFMTQPKREHIAATLVKKDIGLETFCPRISKKKITKRGHVKYVEAMFPCYLFIKADLPRYYRHISSIKGIRKLLAYGDQVPLIPESFIESLYQLLDLKEEQMKIVDDDDFKSGEIVRVREGPFRELEFVVRNSADGQQRVAVLMELLGQEVELKFPMNLLYRDESFISQAT